MKINFKNSEFEDIYKVGNVIKGRDGFIYLIVKEELGYTVVDFAQEGQALVNAELTILQGGN